MRRVLSLLTLLFIGMSYSISQTKLNASQQTEIINKINATSSVMKTMQCDFVQTKKMKLLKNDMISSGVMFFKNPKKLRWQYKTPYNYIFILNGDNVQIKSDRSTQNIDVQRNKMFRQISDVILNSITGGHLKSSAEFDVEIWKTKNIYSAKLLPKKKELKKLYNSIEIVFNTSLTMVESVKMEEKTGDTTIVKLNNVKTNININEGLFTLH